MNHRERRIHRGLMKFKKGDIIKVMLGEYKGKQGKILKTLPSHNTCIVEGVNFYIKHQRRVSESKNAGRLKKEGPIKVSNIRLVCPKCGVPTRIGKKKLGDSYVRICKKCSEMIDG